jgi:hypothetical protein
MKKETKMEILKSQCDSYFKASKKEKGRILNELCKLCRLTRKHVIKRLAKPFVSAFDKKSLPKKKRTPKYSRALIVLIAEVWKSFNFPCGPKLEPIIKENDFSIKKNFHVSEHDYKLMCQISPAQLDRRLKYLTRDNKMKVACCTRPGRHLKVIIPLVDPSIIPKQQGSCSMDLVAHCGDNLSGDFAYSINFTDHFSGWTIPQAFMGKSQINTVDALDFIMTTIPFNIKKLNSDNGSEFINAHLLKFCKSKKIRFFRSRQYKKNDNARIEQKNFTHIRKLVGYLRYDSPYLVSLLNKLYADATLFQNLFVPQSKLVSKKRVASKLVKKFDHYQTPLNRLLNSKSKNLNRSLLNHYVSLRNSIDPFELSASIDRQVKYITKIASKFKANAKLLKAA